MRYTLWIPMLRAESLGPKDSGQPHGEQPGGPSPSSLARSEGGHQISPESALQEALNGAQPLNALDQDTL